MSAIGWWLMLRNAFARFRTVRVRITAIATVLTGVALTVSAVLLVSSVERRLEAQVRADTKRVADNVTFAVQNGATFDQAVAVPFSGTAVYILDQNGHVLATGPGVAAGGVVGVGPLPDARLISGGVPFEVSTQYVGAPGPDVKVVAASPLAEVQRSVRELSHLLWAGIPFLVVLVGGLAWMLVGRALKPVDSMRRAVDEIGHRTLHYRGR